MIYQKNQDKKRKNRKKNKYNIKSNIKKILIKKTNENNKENGLILYKNLKNYTLDLIIFNGKEFKYFVHFGRLFM